MALFSLALAETLKHEGGYSNNPSDSGGETNMGITQKDVPGVNIKEITVAQASEYYESHFWPMLYGEISSQTVANKLFDMGVLFGLGTAIILLQRALGITSDGKFGPQTLATVNAQGETGILLNYRGELKRYAMAVSNSHSQDFVFVRGWLNRINS